MTGELGPRTGLTPGRLAGWLGWAGLALAAVVRYSWQATDDIYITYRYADNLAAGRGLVFNPGERVFGVSDPGVAVALAALRRATGAPIPWLGTVVTAIALLGVAGTLLAAARPARREAEAWVGGTVLLSSAYIWLGQGSGPLPALALLLAGALWASRGRAAAAGVLAGLSFCCRPDAALGAGCLGALLVAEGLRRVRAAGGPRLAQSVDPGGRTGLAAANGAVANDRLVPAGDPRAGRNCGSRSRQDLAHALLPALLFAAAFAAVATVALVIAWRYFGSALPETLGVKRQYAALRPEEFVGRSFWQPAVELFVALNGPGGVALLVLGVAGHAVLFLRGGWPGRLLVLDSLVTAAFYTAARVPFFLWYTTVSAVAVLYGACLFGGELLRHALKRRGGAGWRILAAAACGIAGLAVVSGLVASVRWWSAGGSQDWRLTAYRQAGDWIRTHTPSDASVAFDEVGILGYSSDRPLLDLVGLVSRSSRPYAAVGDPVGAFLAAPTDLVVFHTYNRRGGTRPIRDRPWFADAYVLVAVLPGNETGTGMVIYRRRPGAPLPPPRPPWGWRVSGAVRGR